MRLGAKRAPIAAGIRADGTGVVRVARTEGIAERIRRVAPGLEIEEVDLPGPPTSISARAAGWAEAEVLLAAIAAATGSLGPGEPVRVESPDGGVAEARIDPVGQGVAGDGVAGEAGAGDGVAGPAEAGRRGRGWRGTVEDV